MARKCEVPGTPRTKIRAELSSSGSDVRPAGLTPHKKSTPRSYGMGIVFCITNGAHRLPPRCPEQSHQSTAPLFRFCAPFAFLREVCCGTFDMDVQLWYGRIGVTTSFAAYLVLLHVWRLQVRTAVGLALALDPLGDLFLGSGESRCWVRGSFVCLMGKTSRAPWASSARDVSLREQCKFVLLALFWQTEHAADSHKNNLWATCPGNQPQVKTTNVKTTGSQRTDDVGQPASTPEACSVDFG